MDTARSLQERWLRRAESVERFEGVVESIRTFVATNPLALVLPLVSASPTPTPPQQAAGQPPASASSNGGAASASVSIAAAADAAAAAGGSAVAGAGRGGADLAEWDRRVRLLEVAIAEAKDSNVSVSKAKRLLKELQVGAPASPTSWSQSLCARLHAHILSRLVVQEAHDCTWMR